MSVRERLRALPKKKREKLLATLDEKALALAADLAEPLEQFIPRVTPELEAPLHLAPILDVFETALERPRWVVASTPPQHGKSQTAMHGLIWLLKKDPAKRHAYVTYEATRAERQNEELQKIATRAGLPWVGNRTLWRTPQGGGIVAAGIGGPLTGEPVDGVMLVDDPVKNQVEAQSALIRERTDEWFKTVATTRCHPSSSKFVIQTRWHEDDLAGRLIQRPGWERINLPAIDRMGHALWPKGRPVDFLERVKIDVGEYIWAALYQGEPRPRGGQVFRDVQLCDGLPPGKPFRLALGVDCAYTARKSSDYSVAVLVAECEELFYVVDVVRLQVPIPAFKARLDSIRFMNPGASSRWYTSTTEAGLSEMLGIDPQLAREDKFVRAQPVAAAWNAGKVLIPRDAHWAQTFLQEISTFTGVRDAHDDQVDALAAAYDELTSGWKPDGDGLAKYQGFKSRDLRGAVTEPMVDRPASHAYDMDKIKRNGRW